MTKSQALIYSLLGPSREDIRPLAEAVDIAACLMFERKIPMDDILVTKHIYPIVAENLNIPRQAAERKIERAANHCWQLGDQDELETIIGKRLSGIRAPRDMIFYFAFYLYLGKPFYEAINEENVMPF